jgi:hypothetical protein
MSSEARKSILLCILFSGSFLTGCSTVERYVYYSPQVAFHTQKPESLSPGAKTVQGLPDRYMKADSYLTVTANQRYEPYLWGPWFITVVPVFPLTWLAELVKSNKVTIKVTYSTVSELANEAPTFSISEINNTSEVLKPATVERNESWHDKTITYTVRFASNFRKVDAFIFHIQGGIKYVDSLDIPYVRTSRWAWSQLDPNS